MSRESGAGRTAKRRAIASGMREHAHFQDYGDRRRAVLKAAARVFSRQGYERANVRAIAAEAGMSPAGIYYYLGSKEKALFEIQRETFSSVVTGLDALLTSAATPEERLRAVARNHVAHFLANMDELRVCTHEMETLGGGFHEEVLSLRREYFYRVREVVRGLGHEDPGTTALLLFGALNWLYMWYDPGKNAADTIIETVSRTFRVPDRSGAPGPEAGRRRPARKRR